MKDISFYVDDETYNKIKSHAEINWSKIIRESVLNHLRKNTETDVISINELRDRLDPKILQKLEKLDEKAKIEF